MVAILTALAVGTFWFYALLLAALVLITICVEKEDGFWATVSLLGTCAVLNYASHVPIVKFVLSDPRRTGLLVGAYFLLGAIWGIVKWVFFVHSNLERYNEAKAEFMKANGLSAIDTPKAAFDLRSFLSRDSEIEVNPQVSNHKADVTFWMSYWPFSALWTLVNDPVRKFFRMIYTYLQGTMQSISDRMFKHATAEMSMADSYVPDEKKNSRYH